MLITFGSLLHWVPFKYDSHCRYKCTVKMNTPPPPHLPTPHTPDSKHGWKNSVEIVIGVRIVKLLQTTKILGPCLCFAERLASITEYDNILGNICSIQ